MTAVKATANRVFSRVSAASAAFPEQSRVLGLGRTIVALAQASVLGLTPSAYLFVPVGTDEFEPTCDAPYAVGAYCLANGIDRQIVSWFLLAILLVVASGLLPRYTALPHFWVSFSIHGHIALLDGGETAAQVGTAFLVLACANDRRMWHWQRPRNPEKASVFQGVAWAGHWGLRLQLAYLYFNSSAAKLAVEQWGSGTAVYYVTRMESFGASGLFADTALWLTAVPAATLVLSWGTVVGEAGLAFLILRGGRMQVLAFAVCAVLHIGIILSIGIVSFGLTMVGLVMCATSRGLSEYARRTRVRGQEDREVLGPSTQAPKASEKPAKRPQTTGQH
ncbi:hypothetical protein GCM10007079_04460 [Nocardiopsis terrae]|uniref:Antimicrobial peptide system SdpB family protein n=1 Tax=Nocardiopsis terrae TaxID=372655 RepID=A0ABR9HNF7_9ACTN|nr:sporulation-delaying protein SdpB family protein [Nocardiopsis terrae]MBE1460498.1 antimicrobial peptide system SdpB family protein [Nocardiopsis terrae]GHC71760.1 hypothetical protein GCM10007079_04460 [Nocardiopsis terrae]